MTSPFLTYCANVLGEHAHGFDAVRLQEALAASSKSIPPSLHGSATITVVAGPNGALRFVPWDNVRQLTRGWHHVGPLRFARYATLRRWRKEATQ
jgi:hypothetical protein